MDLQCISIKNRLEEELIIAKNKEKFNKIDLHYFRERAVAFQLLNSSGLLELHQVFESMDKKYSNLKNKCFGTIIGESSILREKYQFHSVILFVEDPNEIMGIPYFLEEGEYICLVSTGGKDEQEKAYKELLHYAKLNNLTPKGDGVFILLSHNHSKNSKLLFEIQIPVVQKDSFEEISI